MTTIAKLVVSLKLNDTAYRKGLAASIKATRQFAANSKKAADDTAKKTTSRFAKFGQNVAKQFTAIGSKINTAFGGKLGTIGKSIQSKIGPALSKIGPMASKAGAAIKSGMAIAGKAALAGAAAFAGVGIAAVAAFAKITKGALGLAQAAAPVQGIRGAFNALTADIQGGSSAILSSLQKASAGMVTNAELMRQFNAAAQLISVDFAKKLPDAMASVGKVAAATGQDMDFLMNSLITGVGRLSPAILDNLSIQVDLTAAYEDFADANGLVAGELTKAQQQMAVMNQATEKLQTNTAKMPEVFGSASQIFGAFRTDIQNIKDDVGSDLLPVFSNLFNTFRKGMPLLKIFGQGFAGAFSGIVNVGKQVVGGFMRGFGVDMDNLAGNAESWGENIVTQLARGMAKAIGAVISVLNTLGKAIAGWLAPGSPPKLLPDLPKWGQNVTDQFLKGMGEGDFSVFKDLSSTVGISCSRLWVMLSQKRWLKPCWQFVKVLQVGCQVIVTY